MNKKGATIYAIFCTLSMIAGFALVFFFAWQKGTTVILNALFGFAVGLVFAPIMHELGHIIFGYTSKMYCVYAKFFCFKIYIKEGKRRLGFASPFAPDQTQMIPKSGGDMQKRAKSYTLGGLIMSGYLLLILLAGAILCSALGKTSYYLWGTVPYVAYLFLLNVMPCYYASGKTDMLVYQGIKRGYAEEKYMLSAMEIQGQLFAGKTFKEIDEDYYFDLPQIAEDEPLFIMLLDLRYRYYLDKEDFSNASDCLTRLAQVQEYLTNEEFEMLAAELVYMHSIRGDVASAEESGRLCRDFLARETLTAKRILAAYSHALGKMEGVETLLSQAEALTEKEPILGLRRFEKSLLQRIKTD